VVQLETEWSRLSRDVDEQRDQVDGLQTRLSDAALLADSQMAEQGSSLVEVDPAFKPTKPTGKGKTILVLAGVFLFGALGMTLALGLAIIDDRIYRRHDLDVLELAPVLAVIPKHQKRRKGKR